MDIEQMTDKEKTELHIDYVNESYLVFTGRLKTLEINKYDDGDVELNLDDGRERITYVFNKNQIEFLSKWLGNSH